VDNALDLEAFRRDFKINVLKIADDEMVFEMIGIDAPIANAFRRILIAEVPTMAIDQVYIYNNTSVIQDEVLAHRLGLVPIRADPQVFDFKGKDCCFDRKEVKREGERI
jgi:DNA-directed RNA polymerase I and III subunit RPAC1